MLALSKQRASRGAVLDETDAPSPITPAGRHQGIANIQNRGRIVPSRSTGAETTEFHAEAGEVYYVTFADT